MLIILSPAKTLNFETSRIIPQLSFPEYEHKANTLVALLQKYSVTELMELMQVSKRLAILNYNRYLHWFENAPIETKRQAACAFNGEAYSGLNVDDWSEEDFAFAQNHLRILSGLYGVLRPLDYINEYRLEMGSKLLHQNGDTMYQFWGDLIAQSLNEQIKTMKSKVLVNLASGEYFKAVNTKVLQADIITPAFKEYKNGDFHVVSVYAKKARGMMSRFAILNRIENAEELKLYNDEGYQYNDLLSKGNNWVFTR